LEEWIMPKKADVQIVGGTIELDFPLPKELRTQVGEKVRATVILSIKKGGLRVRFVVNSTKKISKEIKSGDLDLTFAPDLMGQVKKHMKKLAAG
jgi:hypothetical protein